MDADAVVQPCFDYLLILPTVFSLVRYTRRIRTGLKVTTPLLVKILLCEIDKILHYQLTIIAIINVGLGVVTLPILPIDKLLLPTGKELFL